MSEKGTQQTDLKTKVGRRFYVSVEDARKSRTTKKKNK